MAELYAILLIDETKIAVQHHTQFITKPYGKQIKKKKKLTKPTDLVSTWVEEVAQTDYVAVVQLSHDLQLPVLQNKGKLMNDNEVSCYIRVSRSRFKKWVSWIFWRSWGTISNSLLKVLFTGLEVNHVTCMIQQ